MTGQPASAEITSDDKLWAALGYLIFPIAIVMLLMEEKKSRPFIKYHAVQALAFSLVLYIVMGLIALTGILACLSCIIWLASFYPAYKAYKGDYLALPVITDFIKNQGWV